MFRLFIFLMSYGLMILSIGNLILYLNYRTLGYSWSVVLKFIMHTTEFYIAIGACIVLCSVVLDFGFDKTANLKDKA
ncbi:hypothetical protein FCT18_18585 [Lysinibacillus sphaericus]|uniref:Uncharacterized protein n=3 Tax=Lysinibacillus TaxID=400634 RepID=A0A2S5D4J3_LYSSH|nr:MULTISPECIES: hypothetical protein [Lysinibacillus]AVK98300.1 hypothetical protein LS41612_19325 [Lysinibacillus sphaericus]MCS1383928.1 hypothetical protein [Lysinibacillus sphaericus]MED4543816.1 hypothetical protein [Lysinibacillus sphaericus]OEC02846.1 hypothetical protein GY31_07330 [Lysinibacillus sphaericus]POZ57979.1 hypothetical protein LYSIN_02763 [Lysinibacillus sphaericus]